MTKTSTFIVPPHLAEYNTPLADFVATKPEFNYFVVGAYIFAKPHPLNPEFHTLLLQRAFSDSYGGYWENPGGSVEPTDATLLDAVARELVEETGLHVSKFVDLVCVDQWLSVKPDRVTKVAKFSFVVEVYEAADEGWMDRVILDDQEHRAITWAMEEEVREGIEGVEELKFIDEQGRSLLRAFGVWRERQK